MTTLTVLTWEQFEEEYGGLIVGGSGNPIAIPEFSRTGSSRTWMFNQAVSDHVLWTEMVDGELHAGACSGRKVRYVATNKPYSLVNNLITVKPKTPNVDDIRSKIYRDAGYTICTLIIQDVITNVDGVDISVIEHPEKLAQIMEVLTDNVLKGIASEMWSEAMMEAYNETLKTHMNSEDYGKFYEIGDRIRDIANQ